MKKYKNPLELQESSSKEVGLEMKILQTKFMSLNGKISEIEIKGKCIKEGRRIHVPRIVHNIRGKNC